MAKLLLINGPNLNLLGSRERDVYGNTELGEIEGKLRESYFSDIAAGCFFGLGADSYELALDAAIRQLDQTNNE